MKIVDVVLRERKKEIPAGLVGTIVETHKNGEAFEVEFHWDNETHVLTLDSEDIHPKVDMFAVRMTTDKDGSNVLVNTGFTPKGFDEPLEVWIDIWEDGGETQMNWNKYIFYLDNPEDVAISNFQSSCLNFDDATEVAIEFFDNQK